MRPGPVAFHPTAADLRILRSARRDGEQAADVLRRALRALEREAWTADARVDARRLAGEDLSAGPDAW
ncbi:hypothetical protein [Nocardiopsis potens]|uniref:hypothetical protein n=1 Tax=Nocardiopsis potens TaxID=1246458 RepID=UPI000346CCC2|nr:hypothetical protein [Nocardiopsis potens]